ASWSRSPPSNVFRCISSAWVKGSRTFPRSPRGILPQRSPASRHDNAMTPRYTQARMNDKPAKHKLNPTLKLALDLGPLVVFVIAYARFDIFVATAVFMATTVVAMAVSYVLTRHVTIMLVVTSIVIMVFGTLTLVLHNETFIKLKPTIIYLLFSVTLFGGYLFNKPLLAVVFDAMVHLTDEGWRKLTLRWAVFFLVMAVLNEVVRLTQTTQF